MNEENQIVAAIGAAIKKGHRYIGFVYRKENGETSNRVVGMGAEIPKAQEKRGTPLNGRGSWMTGYTSGKNSFAIFKNGEWQIRGYDRKDNRLKCFKVSGMSEIKGICYG